MPVPKFKHTSRADFKTQFFNRIGDSSKRFWTDSEIDIILAEALYTLGAVGQTWRNQIELKTVVAQSFYDISSDLTAETQEQTAYNLTYQFILDIINFHLIEEVSIVNQSSEVTNLTEILKFARNRVNQFQFQTGLILSRKNFNMNPPNDNTVIIDDEIIDIVRVAYVDFDELFNPDQIFVLKKEDEDSIGHFNRNAFNLTTDRPTFYTSILGNLNTIRIYPLPSNLGALEIISINGIPVTTMIDLGTKIGIPDNLVPYIKWGILADIYAKEGIGYNPAMANYCEGRWNEGITIGTNYTSILEAKLNRLPILLDSIFSLDNNQNGWQNSIDAPSLIAIAGYNLIVTNCKPDAIYSLLMYSVTNAYIPVDDNDFVDIKLEYIEPLLNYCIHLANVKNGFEDIKNTSALKDDFIKMAVKNNIRLTKRGFDVETMLKKTKREEEDNPIRVEEVAA